jgi:hypothetical protein
MGSFSLVASSGYWNTPDLDDGQHRAFYYGQSGDLCIRYQVAVDRQQQQLFMA